jgi:hypothetical protein
VAVDNLVAGLLVVLEEHIQVMVVVMAVLVERLRLALQPMKVVVAVLVVILAMAEEVVTTT